MYNFFLKNGLNRCLPALNKGGGVVDKATEVAIHMGLRDMGCCKMGLGSVAESVSVCSDSNYNQTATHYRRGTKNRRQTQAGQVDDEHRSHSIIYLFGKIESVALMVA
jgi:hypothetical protein